MNAYIYLFCDRLVYWKEYNPFYRVVRRLNNVKWYAVHGTATAELDDMVRQENYTYNLRDGFHTINAEFLAAWNERGDLIRKIQVLEKLNSLMNSQKMNYTDNGIGQSLTDVLLIDEIRRYQASKSLEGCSLLTAYLDNSEATLSAEALVTKLWLKYESYAQLIGSLNRLETNIRRMLNNLKFDEATALLTAEFEKIRM